MSEKKKNKRTKKETKKTSCTPEAMQDSFQKMAACCPGLKEMPDCKAMMKSMKEKFCGQESEGTKTGCGN